MPRDDGQAGGRTQPPELGSGAAHGNGLLCAGSWNGIHQQSHLRAIGIDEISIRKGHTYAIVVADLDQQRPIWLGGQGRSEEDMKLFFDAMGPERCKTIRLAVMDMWKPFRNVTFKQAPDAQIVFDKFHVMRHLSTAIDQVRRSEYKRVNEKERRFIKGQRYTLLSHKANLDIEGRRALRMLLKANKRLNKAYLLKESFGQLVGL